MPVISGSRRLKTLILIQDVCIVVNIYQKQWRKRIKSEPEFSTLRLYGFLALSRMDLKKAIQI